MSEDNRATIILLFGELYKLKMTEVFGEVPERLFARRIHREEELHFFDTHELTLYQQHRGLYSVQHVIGNGLDRYKAVLEDNSEGSESGYPLEFEAKKYQRRTAESDLHPLLGLVKRGIRASFIKTLKVNGIKEPRQLKEVLQVKKDITVTNILLYSKPIASVSIAFSEVSLFGQKEFLYELLIARPSCQTLNQLSVDEVDYLDDLFSIFTKYANKSIDQSSYYRTYTDLISERFPLWKLWVANPLLVKLIQLIFLVAISILILYVALRRYAARK